MSKRWLMIADAHLTCREPEEDFFRMLGDVSQLPGDVGIIFLGDIFDLWIALRGYENDEHRRFLDWCRREKTHRQIVFLEGNHEFYLKRHHEGCFTVCNETFYKSNDILFLHGDVAQKKFGFHRCFRAFAKNAFGDWVMGWLPFGPAFASIMKRFLSSGGLPDFEKLKKPLCYAERRVASFCRKFDVSHVIMGHFHHPVHRDLSGGKTMDIIPAWKTAGKIGLLTADGAIEVLSWKKLKTKMEQMK